jgi:hypothetical protein
MSCGADADEVAAKPGATVLAPDGCAGATEAGVGGVGGGTVSTDAAATGTVSWRDAIGGSGAVGAAAGRAGAAGIDCVAADAGADVDTGLRSTPQWTQNFAVG